MARLRPKSSYRKNTSQPKGQKGRSQDNKKNIHSKSTLYKRFANHLGKNYTLQDIQEIRYPFWRVKLAILSTGRPDNVIQEVHLILLELVQLGIHNREEIAQFLGLGPEDFILDELTKLREQNLIIANERRSLKLTSQGEIFLKDKSFIPVSREVDFEFLVDGFDGSIQIDQELAIKNQEELLKPDTNRPDHDFILQNWTELTSTFARTNEHSQLVDLAEHKRSIRYSDLFYQQALALLYFPEESTGGSPQLKIITQAGRILERESKILRLKWLENPALFENELEVELTELDLDLFSQEKNNLQHQKSQFSETSYQDLTTFELKELLISSLKNAQKGILIESPWIKRISRTYLPLIEGLIKRKVSVCILYGISFRQKQRGYSNDDEKVIKKLSQLAEQNPDLLKLIFMPEHFQKMGISHEGTHRKTLICDDAYFVKGSYNWLSFSWKKEQKYPLEQGTKFQNGAREEWLRIFKEYRLDMEWLKFLH